MNQYAGRLAVRYGRIGENYAVKKHKLLRTGGSHDALFVRGNLFGMSQKHIEIKSAQLFSRSGSCGEFMFNVENHKSLVSLDGDYIFVFMRKKEILFDLRVKSSKIKPARRYKIPRKNKSEFFRVKTNFFIKLSKGD